MSEKDDLISVIVPIYNVSEYVEKCIQSLISQTHRNLEIILVDDGSTDDSGAICDQYADRNQRICVYHKKNGGLSDARNYGIERANGSFFAFVDGDDWVHPQMYELLYKFLKKENADVVTCGFERKNPSFAEKSVEMKDICYKVLTREQALADIETPLVVAWNKLYKKEIFDVCRYPAGRLHEDEFVIHEIFWQCNKVVTLETPLYFYTDRETSIIARLTEKRINDALTALENRVRFASEHQWTEVMTAVLERYCDYTIDRYNDVKRQKDGLDEGIGTMLWNSERKLLNEFQTIPVQKKYKLFAKSPEHYEKWLERKRMRDDRRQLIEGTIVGIAKRLLRY